jgi:hypothetical protein
MITNTNASVFDHIKTYYKCYEIVKNGSLRIHTLLLLKDSLDPNTVIQLLHDDEEFQENISNHMNDIIIRNIDMYKSFNETTHENNGKNNENNIHAPQDPLTPMQITSTNYLNVCNRHMCNPTCYKSNVDASNFFCKYGFP